eukprot:m.244020 g.244020  ORF g.244020 m.244020 type:complete len:629 (-) comp14372_c0_seq1:164-2050(-)
MAVDQAGAVRFVYLVDFHHKFGPQVEFMYPPSPTEETLPPEWAHMPFLALPDGVHKWNQDATFFTLPPCALSPDPLYAVACVRQISAADLVRADDAVTRNTVLKSVCVVSKLPLFGLLYDHLATTTEVLFAQKDFSEKDLLESLYQSLSHRFSTISLSDDTMLFAGCSLRSLVVGLRHGLVQIFKAILLQKKIIVHGGGTISTHDVCSRVLAIASLVPGVWRSSTVEIAASESIGRLQPVGGPLGLLDGCLYPLVALQQMDDLMPLPSFLAGTSNQLLINHPGLAEVVVDVGAQPSVQARGSHMKSLLDLTTQDLRFSDAIVQTVIQSAVGDDVGAEVDCWQGSSAWIRRQFSDYLMSLLATADHARTLPAPLDGDAMADFGSTWTAAWMNTPCYRGWRARAATLPVRPSHVHAPGHINAGALRLKDIGLHVSRVLGPRTRKDKEKEKEKEEGKESSINTEAAAAAIQGAITSLKSSWSTFWKNRGSPSPSRRAAAAKDAGDADAVPSSEPSGSDGGSPDSKVAAEAPAGMFNPDAVRSKLADAAAADAATAAAKAAIASAAIISVDGAVSAIAVPFSPVAAPASSARAEGPETAAVSSGEPGADADAADATAAPHDEEDSIDLNDSA